MFSCSSSEAPPQAHLLLEAFPDHPRSTDPTGSESLPAVGRTTQLHFCTWVEEIERLNSATYIQRYSRVLTPGAVVLGTGEARPSCGSGGAASFSSWCSCCGIFLISSFMVLTVLPRYCLEHCTIYATYYFWRMGSAGMILPPHPPQASLSSSHPSYPSAFILQTWVDVGLPEKTQDAQGGLSFRPFLTANRFCIKVCPIPYLNSRFN